MVPVIAYFQFLYIASFLFILAILIDKLYEFITDSEMKVVIRSRLIPVLELMVLSFIITLPIFWFLHLEAVICTVGPLCSLITSISVVTYLKSLTKKEMNYKLDKNHNPSLLKSFTKSYKILFSTHAILGIALFSWSYYIINL